MKWRLSTEEYDAETEVNYGEFVSKWEKVHAMFKLSKPGVGALWYLGGRMRSLSKFKDTPKALISGRKSTLILL